MRIAIVDDIKEERKNVFKADIRRFCNASWKLMTLKKSVTSSQTY